MTPDFDHRLLGTPEGWRLLARLDPKAFALLYLPHHLRSEHTGDVISFAEHHLDWIAEAKQWVRPSRKPMESRDCYVAPRESGKSTWFFLILPLWAAAFGYVRFAAAFADSAIQAETHLATFKRELDTNLALRTDFSALCAPAMRPRGVQVADNRGMLYTRSGFVFAARGIDSSNLGLKVGSQRPDLIILDDVEPGEDGYSALQADKRRSTIADVIFPLNVSARVVWVGTVTMPGSLVHQLVRSVRGEEPTQWAVDERIETHYHPPILVDDDGSERSAWPQRWPIEYLQSIRHTRSYAKNMANDPMGFDGDYWSVADIRYGNLEAVTRKLLSVDPAVTTKQHSDLTGLAVVSYSPSEKACEVERAESVRLTGELLRQYIVRILEADPTIGLIYVETNQGGELWPEVFHGLPVRVKTIHQTIKKEIRTARALGHYQRGSVLHSHRLAAAEEQLVAFPKAPHDDIVDAICAGVSYFLDPVMKARTVARSISYLG